MTDDALIAGIRDYKQADAEGIMVLVSRQACDEAAARIAALTAEVEASYTEEEFRSMQRMAERAEAERDALNVEMQGLRNELQEARDAQRIYYAVPSGDAAIRAEKDG